MNINSEPVLLRNVYETCTIDFFIMYYNWQFETCCVELSKILLLLLLLFSLLSVTVGSKIIRALEIVLVKKLIPNAVLWKIFINSWSLSFKLFTTSMRWFKLAGKLHKITSIIDNTLIILLTTVIQIVLFYNLFYYIGIYI